MEIINSVYDTDWKKERGYSVPPLARVGSYGVRAVEGMLTLVKIDGDEETQLEECHISASLIDSAISLEVEKNTIRVLVDGLEVISKGVD